MYTVIYYLERRPNVVTHDWAYAKSLSKDQHGKQIAIIKRS